MKIGMVLQSRMPPNDIRVEKEAWALLEAGHEVHLLLEGGGARPREEDRQGIKLLRGVAGGRMRDTYRRYTFNFTFRDAPWRRAIEGFIRERGVEALHVHDLPLVGEAVRAGRRFGIPVVADLHENFPAGLQAWYANRLKRATIYRYGRWARYERSVLAEVDAVIAVIEESKRRLEGIGVQPDKIFVVPNTERRTWGEAAAVDPVVLERYRDDFVLSYIGKFSVHRGLDVVVRAMPEIRREIPRVKLVLVGDRNRPYRRRLSRLIERTGVEDVVELAGWQPFERIWSYISASDVCLVPHSRNPHTDTTIPHKIFQYMLLGKPAIVSDCPPLARVVTDAGAGLVFRHDSPADFAACVLKLYADPELRARMAASGREAFFDRYSWETTHGELLRLYEMLAAGERPAAAPAASGAAGDGGAR